LLKGKDFFFVGIILSLKCIKVFGNKNFGILIYVGELRAVPWTYWRLPCYPNGARTLSRTTLSRTKLSITTLSKTTPSITTLSIMAFSITMDKTLHAV
jgi:hypothetical protein